MACGGNEPHTAPSGGRLDLAQDEPAFTISFRPGDVQGGAPSSVAAGDFNADGTVDLLLGAPFADGPDATRTDGGEALVLFGPIDRDRDLESENADVRIIGASPGDALGAGVAAGDLNGDGVDDVIVGAPGSNGIPEVRTDMGEAYVIFGGNLPPTIDVREKQYDFLLQPAEGFSTLGKTFAMADVNDDGRSDLIAGAPYAGRVEGTPPGSPRTTVGEVYVVFGSDQLPDAVTVTAGEEDVRLSGVNSYDQFGGSVSAADVDANGVSDIVVGASGYDGPGGDSPEAGGVFVFFGGADLPYHQTLNEANLTITGEDAGDTFGTLVAASDVNEDGGAEIIATAPAAAGPLNDRFGSGEAVVVDLTAHSSDALTLSSADGFRVYAPTNGELLTGPIAVSEGASPRLALGSTQRSTPGRPGSGWTYLLAAPRDGDVDIASETSGALQIQGAAEGDGLGAALAFVDLSGDGRPELLVEAGGVPLQGTDVAFVGGLHVIFLP